MPNYIKVMERAYGRVAAVPNPKRILLITLRHTGCTFFSDLLTKEYFKWAPKYIHCNADEFKRNYSMLLEDQECSFAENFNPFVRIHTEWESTILEYWNRFGKDEKPIVVTCERDLEKVRKSYIRRVLRFQPMGYDSIISEEIAGRAFEKHYEHHLSVLEQIKPDFTLSVDADNKQERLDELATAIGAPLITDWTPVNQTEGTQAKDPVQQRRFVSK